MADQICCKNDDVREIDLENIWEGDLFSRKAIAKDFTKIVTSITQPFVLS